MTWVKPLFLWLMERSNWGLKPGQEAKARSFLPKERRYELHPVIARRIGIT